MCSLSLRAFVAGVVAGGVMGGGADIARDQPAHHPGLDRLVFE
ncbi:hypothetical protein [Acrocarpospora pleiomorpha]|nr:hypothetical protein [Acrocarpospora pleiomorpha]